jgi:hypothetical protein
MSVMDEVSQKKSRIAYLGGDPRPYKEIVSRFERAYVDSRKPDSMAMFSHTDSTGMLMAVSITPQAVLHCPFSATWAETDNPFDYGHVGWAGDDPRLKK